MGDIFLYAMALTQVVFVGHQKARLVDSIRKAHDYPVTRVILAVGEQNSAAEERAEKIAGELMSELATVFDTDIVRIDKKDIMRGATQIIELAMREKAKGNDFLINMSGSLRTFSIAGYIAGCLTQSKMITSIPKYGKNDEEIGIVEIIEVPPLPLNFLKPEQLTILLAIGDDEISLEELIFTLNPGIRKGVPAIDYALSPDADGGLEKYTRPGKKPAIGEESAVASFDKPIKILSNERSRLIHHLKKFEEMGLIKREKRGKNVIVKLTNLGWMFKRVE